MATEVNSFVSRKKLEILATAIRDQMPYIRTSSQRFDQASLKGKKFGAKVTEYLTDAGTVSDGIVANPDAIHEREVTAFVQNKNSAVETTFWENFHNIEDKQKLVIRKRAELLSRKVEADVINHSALVGMQAICKAKVGGAMAPDFDMLSDAATKLAELSVTGDLVDFQSPTIYGKIANGGLAKFIPSDIQKDIYRERYLGQYAGAACVEQALMPRITLSSNAADAPTLKFTPVKDDSNNIIGYTVGALTANSTKALEEGAAYVVPGVYLLDESGMETNQPLVVIVHKKINGFVTSTVNGETVITKANQGKLSETLGIEDLFVTAKGYSFGTPNVWVDPATFDSGSTDTTVTCSFIDGMAANKSYIVGQVRTADDSLVFDAYTYEDLPGSRRENVGSDGPIVLKAMSFGDGKNGVELTRIDVSYIAKIFEPRRCVVTFTEC